MKIGLIIIVIYFLIIKRFYTFYMKCLSFFTDTAWTTD